MAENFAENFEWHVEYVFFGPNSAQRLSHNELVLRNRGRHCAVLSCGVCGRNVVVRETWWRETEYGVLVKWETLG